MGERDRGERRKCCNESPLRITHLASNGNECITSSNQPPTNFNKFVISEWQNVSELNAWLREREPFKDVNMCVHNNGEVGKCAVSFEIESQSVSQSVYVSPSPHCRSSDLTVWRSDGRVGWMCAEWRDSDSKSPQKEINHSNYICICFCLVLVLYAIIVNAFTYDSRLCRAVVRTCHGLAYIGEEEDFKIK